MPKYKLKIGSPGGSPVNVYLESDSRWDAENLVKMQYPGCNIWQTEEVQEEATFGPATQRSTSMGEVVAGIILVTIGLGIYFAYGVFKDFTSSDPKVASSPAVEVETSVDAEQADPEASIAANGDGRGADEGVVDAVAAVEEPSTSRAVTPEGADRGLSQAPSPLARARLAKFDVRVKRLSGDEEVLVISARDEQHAREVVRNFRGDPLVLEVSANE